MNELHVHYFLYHYWNKEKSRREMLKFFFIWSDLHCLNTHKNYSVNRKSIYRKSCAGYCAAVRDLVCLTGSGEATLFFVVVLAEIFDRELFFLFGFWTRSFETFGTTVFLALEAAKDR